MQNNKTHYWPGSRCKSGCKHNKKVTCQKRQPKHPIAHRAQTWIIVTTILVRLLTIATRITIILVIIMIVIIIVVVITTVIVMMILMIITVVVLGSWGASSAGTLNRDGQPPGWAGLPAPRKIGCLRTKSLSLSLPLSLSLQSIRSHFGSSPKPFRLGSLTLSLCQDVLLGSGPHGT